MILWSFNIIEKHASRIPDNLLLLRGGFFKMWRKTAPLSGRVFARYSKFRSDIGHDIYENFMMLKYSISIFHVTLKSSYVAVS